MSTDQFRIRPATPADSGLIARHRAEMFRDMGRLADEAAAQALHAAAEPELRAWLEAGTYLGWLAVPEAKAEEVAGGAGLQLRALLPRPGKDGRGVARGPEAYILNVFVERAWRRRGAAGLLMDRVLAHVRQEGFTTISLHASDEGRPLYERLGFRETNELRLRALSR
jgi:GNAT superfamily N-acetyltransferase